MGLPRLRNDRGLLVANKSCPRNVIALHRQVAWERFGRNLRGKGPSQPGRRWKRDFAAQVYEADRKGAQDAVPE